MRMYLTGFRSNFAISCIAAVGLIVLLVNNISRGDQDFAIGSIVYAEPIINDSNLAVRTVVTGLNEAVNMAFLSFNNILVTEKNNGTVKLIRDGRILPKPVLDINAASGRGVLGIDIVNVSSNQSCVFLYVSEAASSDDGMPIGNRVYRYTLIENSSHDAAEAKMLNPKLLLDLPIPLNPNHDGGKLMIGPDNNIYLTIGDPNARTKAQNVENGSNPNGTSGILRVDQNGTAVRTGILGNTHPLDKYFAYGIRNSFGIDFDPVTGRMWETENGLATNDEINLVDPGFNSGWRDIMGMAPAGFNFTNLVSFGGKGNYSDPEFVWRQNVAPTALEFLESDELGSSYRNDMFVSDYNKGRIYRFDLNGDRTDLVLPGTLADKVANTDSETQSIIFGEGFGRITDLKVGPSDGYLYVLSISDGAIYEILPRAAIKSIQ